MITVDAAVAMEELGAIVARLRNPSAVLSTIGEREMGLARERIEETKDDAFGMIWDPWADSTARQRVRKGTADLGLLYDRGDLLDSIYFAVEGPDVAIGSDLDYAEWLQEGTSKMPARPFLGWNPEGMEIYETMIAWFVESGVIA